MYVLFYLVTATIINIINSNENVITNFGNTKESGYFDT